MHRLFAIATLTLALGACSDSAGPAANTIDVNDNSFGPSSLSVASGTTVTWDWQGNTAHNVTWVAGTPAASPSQTSGTYTRNFAAAGSFEYYCTIHGTPTTGMRGTITVQ
jgi:plastocyanin